MGEEDIKEEDIKKGATGEEKAGGASEGAGGEEHTGELPPLDFTTFIFSLASSVLMNLGVVENPITKKKEKEPEVARQTIDLIELLKGKTKGNLTEEEAKLLDDLLHELHLRYCRVVGG